jgi:hypothetical protein
VELVLVPVYAKQPNLAPLGIAQIIAVFAETDRGLVKKMIQMVLVFVTQIHLHKDFNIAMDHVAQMVLIITIHVVGPAILAVMQVVQLNVTHQQPQTRKSHTTGHQDAQQIM